MDPGRLQAMVAVSPGYPRIARGAPGAPLSVDRTREEAPSAPSTSDQVPARRYAMSPFLIVPLAHAILFQGAEKEPFAESLPFLLSTKKILPGRTVKGRGFDAVPFTVTTTFPVAAFAPSWQVIF